MADDNEDAEKTEEPSQYRIDEFRKQGQVASSKEVNSLVVLAATILTLTLSAVYIFETLHGFIYWLVNIDAQKAYDDKFIQELFTEMIATGLKCVGPVFLTSFVVSFFSQVSQIGFIYAPDILSIKFDKLNPIAGFKRLFSMKSIVEVIKGIFKFTIILTIAYLILKQNLTSFVGFLHVELPQSLAYGQAISLKLAYAIIMGLVVVAVADYAWEKYSYKQKLKMTKQQVKQESKEKDGNPEIKQRIRSIQKEMSRKRMMNDVPKADAIVTNPTHLSIAIKYDATTMIAPEVIAKGADEVALRIR